MPKHPPIRNLIDLSDPRQVRTLKRRLGVSGADLRRIIEKTGTSIAAITKEVEFEKERWRGPKPIAHYLVKPILLRISDLIVRHRRSRG